MLPERLRGRDGGRSGQPPAQASGVPGGEIGADPGTDARASRRHAGSAGPGGGGLAEASLATWHAGSTHVVLVPLDGSQAAEAAIDAGAAVAQRTGATLHLAAAVSADRAGLDLGSGVPQAQPGSREYPGLLEEYVTRLAERTSRRFGCDVAPTVLDSSDPEDGLAEYAEHAAVDLVVMGVSVPASREDGDTPKLSASATWDAPSPILFLPVCSGTRGRRRAITRPPASPRVVAVVTTTTGEHDAVVELGASYARLWGATLRIFDGAALEPRVGERARREGPAGTDSTERREERLQRLAAALRGEGMRVTTSTLDGGDVERALFAALGSERVDTVVTGHALRPLSERLLFGGPGAFEPPREVSVAGQVAVLVSPR